MMISFQTRGKGHWSAFSPLFVVDLDPVTCLLNGGAEYVLTLRRRNNRKTQQPGRRVVGLKAARAEAEAMLRAAEAPPSEAPETARKAEFADYDADGIEASLERRLAVYERRWKLKAVQTSFTVERCDGRPVRVLRAALVPAESAEHAPTEAAA